MSFNKVTTFKAKVDDFEIIDGELIKTASVKLPDGIDYDPDYLYMRVKAVSAGEYWGDNKNHDYFQEIELKNNYKTFLSAHVFKNHENKKVEAAIGDVLTAEWSDSMKCVYLLIRVDKKIAPSVVRGFEKGFMTDVSMGCRVSHVICSYCGQKAKTRLDYCDHLKTMKGKVMDNGKKVYEINIAPKFHDISVVLNGAERTAKAEKIYSNENEKLACEKTTLEKVASTTMYDEAITVWNPKNSFDSDIEVLASTLRGQDNRVSDTQKIAEFKKELQGKIESLASKDMAKENIDNFESISGILKLLYTKYWDKEKCSKIAQSLKDIAKENRAGLETTFDQFLKVADFAGIELSPLEIHDIFHELIEVDTHDARKIHAGCKVTPGRMERDDKFLQKISPTGTTLSMLGRCSSIANRYDELAPRFHGDSPVLKARVVISNGSIKSELNENILAGIMEHIIKDNMQDRSSHRQFLIPRLEMIANGSIQPSSLGDIHHLPSRYLRTRTLGAMPSFSLPMVIAGLISSKYQSDRVERFNSGELESGMKKIASYLDEDFGFSKTASGDKPGVKFSPGKRKTLKITPTKAALAGIPLTYAYSALQRSRMHNGEDISSFNRYISENPGNAALAQAVITRNSLGQLAPRTADAAKGLVQKGKNADMFKSATLDENLKGSGYDDKDIITIKTACVLNGIGMEDKAEDILNSRGLDFQDIDQYLKTAQQYYKIEIEKTASAIKDISTSVMGDVLLDNPKKTSMAAAIPGYLFDGIALTALGKGLKMATTKNKKGVQENV